MKIVVFGDQRAKPVCTAPCAERRIACVGGKVGDVVEVSSPVIGTLRNRIV